MMKYARLSLLGMLAVVLLSGGFLFGDDKKPDDKKPDDKDPKAKGTLPTHWKKLGLTDDQVQKVYKVEEKYKTKIDALKQQIEDLKAEEKVEREKILTDAQKSRLKELLLGDLKDDPKDKPVEKDKPAEKDKKPADKEDKPKDKPSDK